MAEIKSDHLPAHARDPGSGVSESSFLQRSSIPAVTDTMDPEKTHAEFMNHDSASTSGESLRLDSNGLPLVPQPSRFKDDPLVLQSHFSFSLPQLPVASPHPRHAPLCQHTHLQQHP